MALAHDLRNPLAVAVWRPDRSRARTGIADREVTDTDRVGDPLDRIDRTIGDVLTAAVRTQAATDVRPVAKAHGWAVAVTGGEAGGTRFEFATSLVRDRKAQQRRAGSRGLLSLVAQTWANV